MWHLNKPQKHVCMINIHVQYGSHQMHLSSEVFWVLWGVILPLVMWNIIMNYGNHYEPTIIMKWDSVRICFAWLNWGNSFDGTNLSHGLGTKTYIHLFDRKSWYKVTNFDRLVALWGILLPQPLALKNCPVLQRENWRRKSSKLIRSWSCGLIVMIIKNMFFWIHTFYIQLLSLLLLLFDVLFVFRQQRLRPEY